MAGVQGAVFACFTACVAKEDSGAERKDGRDAGANGDAGAEETNTDLPEYRPPSEPGRHMFELLSSEQVIPPLDATQWPSQAAPMDANNNLDVVRFAGETFLAWRTAPHHYASSDARIFVVKTSDDVHWTYETQVHVGSDVREPRFLALADRLFLYVSVLGTDPLRFEPKSALLTERRDVADWTTPSELDLPGQIVWRAKAENDGGLLVAYSGGEHIYRFDGMPLSIDVFRTRDGYALESVMPESAAPVLRGGGSEMDFARDLRGTVYAVARNEAGDDTGWGSHVCRTRRGANHPWEFSCVHDARKFDSPLMFWHDGEAYLIARRNVTQSGAYETETAEHDRALRSLLYQADYVAERKRCSLWRYVQDEDRIAFIADLPSRGDTCFAGLVGTELPNEFVVYNYSSPLDGPDLSWSRGQRRETRIYRHRIRLSR